MTWKDLGWFIVCIGLWFRKQNKTWPKLLFFHISLKMNREKVELDQSGQTSCERVKCYKKLLKDQLNPH